MLLCLSIALADDAAGRIGLAVAADRQGPLAGGHLELTEPLELAEGAAFRTVVRADLRGWQHPRAPEQEAWAAQGVEGLPSHAEFELTGAMLLRASALEKGWAGMTLGAEVGLTAGLWHHATVSVQEEYAALGATKWPLEEYLLGPELGLGLYSRDDRSKLVWVHRFWIPTHGRLDGQDNRYTVGGNVYEPVQVVNPRFEGGFTGLYSWEHLFVQGTASYLLVLPSAKNREVDQSPPSGSVRADLAVGFSF